MENFQKWAKGRNPFLAVYCHMVATSTGLTYGLFEAIRKDGIFSKNFPLPPLKTWLKLYGKHRAVLNGIWDKFSDFPGTFNFFGKDKWKIKISPEAESDDEIFSEEFKKVFDGFFDKQDSEKVIENYIGFCKAEPDEAQKQKYGEYLLEVVHSPEFLFLVRVYLPSLLLYKEAPANLLRKARRGDLQSLENLLRLDSSAIFDPQISSLVHRIRYEKKSQFEEIISFLVKPPKKKVSRQKEKNFWGGFLMLISKSLGEDLSEPDIKGLYDAIARDHEKGGLDPDIEGQPKSFYIAMWREMSFWLLPDESYKT